MWSSSVLVAAEGPADDGVAPGEPLVHTHLIVAAAEGRHSFRTVA
jgi:hypothetical protein